jgi:hypothetical protein
MIALGVDAMAKRVRRRPDLSKVTPFTPLRLDLAAELSFPDGSMSGHGLRLEAGRGRLAVERIAGKDYTTLAAVEEMRSRCRSVPKASASISENRLGPEKASGSSGTTKAKSALACLLSKTEKLKNASSNTSQKNTTPIEPARTAFGEQQG